MGRIAPEKSITVIIDALKKVVAINDNIRFLIVGGGPQLEELKEYVKNDHIEPYVIFTGPQSGEMVPAHYHISNMFISASLSETQGLTYIEAMASSIAFAILSTSSCSVIFFPRTTAFTAFSTPVKSL